jgi:two-component system, NtrC family, sensor kinase
MGSQGKERPMRRGAKPAKAKVEAKPRIARKSPKSEGSRVGDLEKSLAEAREQQAATAEILRVISGSPTDVQPVFDAIAQNAVNLCEALFSTVFRYDGALIHHAADNYPTAEMRAILTTDYPSPPDRDNATAKAIRERRIVHIADVLHDTAPMGSREVAIALGYRTLLCVPMLRDGVPIGTINVARREPRPFADKQIELIRTFADQAVIAIENVRLFNETKEALEQQTATAEILRVISRSPTEVQPVLDAVAENAARVCGADDAVVQRVEGQVLRLVAHFGSVPVSAVEFMPISPDRPGGRAVLERRTLHVHDLLEEHRRGNYPGSIEHRQRIGYRTQLVTPLLREGTAIGVIVIRRMEVKPFTSKQIELLQTFADQAVIAIENVRLFNETKEALERETATSEILRVIASSPTELQPVLDTIAENAARVCGANDAVIYRIEQGDVTRIVAGYGPIPKGRVGEQRRTLIRGSIPGRAMLERQTVHVHDVQSEEGDDFPFSRELQRHFSNQTRTVLSTPLLREGVSIGAILIRRAEVQPFTDRQIELLQIFADQAVIAIENVRLFTELQEKNRALTQAHAQVTESLEQQTATSEILRVISSSPTDVQPVFDTIVESAARLCDGIFSTLASFDGELIRLVATHNWTPTALDAARRVFPARPSRAMVSGRAILERTVVHVPDVELDREYEIQELVRAVGARSVLGVPMLREGVPLGVILVSRAEPGPFSDNQIVLLKTFADQAVIAIENARLFKELQARTAQLTRSVEELTALGDVGRTLSSTLDLDTVLQTIVTRASQLARTDACSVFEYDEATEAFHLRATHNLDEEVVALAWITPTRKGEGVQGRMAVTRQPVQVADIAAEDAYRGPSATSSSARGPARCSPSRCCAKTS